MVRKYKTSVRARKQTVYARARTTKGGRGPIKKRSAYRRKR